MAVNPRISKDSFFDLDFDFNKFEQDYNTTSTECSTNASITHNFPDYQAPVAGLESPHYASTEMPVPPYSNPIDYSTARIGYMAADDMFSMSQMSLPEELSMLAGGNYSQEEFCDFFNPQPDLSHITTGQERVDHSAGSSLEQTGYAVASDLEASNSTAQSAAAATEDFKALNVQATNQPKPPTPSIAGSPYSSSGPSPPSAAIVLPPTPDSTSLDAAFDARKCASSIEDEEVLQQKLLGDGSTCEEFFNPAREKRASVVDVASVNERTYRAAVEDEALGANMTSNKDYSSTPEIDTSSISADPSDASECRATVGNEVPVDDLTFGKTTSSTAAIQSESPELRSISPPKASATDDELWNEDIAAIFSAEHFQQVPAHEYSDSSASTWSSLAANLAFGSISHEQPSFPEGIGMPLDDQYSTAVQTQASNHTVGYNTTAGSLAGQNFVSNSFINARAGDQYTVQQMQRHCQVIPRASGSWLDAPLDNVTNVSPNMTFIPQRRVYATPKKPSSKLAQPQHSSYHQAGLSQTGLPAQSTAASTRQDLAQRQQTMRNTHPSLMTSRKRKQDELVAAARSDQAKHAATPMYKRARTVPAARNAITHTNARGTSVSMPGKHCPQPAHSTGSVTRRIGQTAMATILGHAAKNGGFIPMKNGRLARVKMTSERDIHFHVLSVEDTARVKMERMETRARELRDGIQQVIDPAECFKQMQSGDGWLT